MVTIIGEVLGAKLPKEKTLKDVKLTRREAKNLHELNKILYICPRDAEVDEWLELNSSDDFELVTDRWKRLICGGRTLEYYSEDVKEVQEVKKVGIFKNKKAK